MIRVTEAGWVKLLLAPVIFNVYSPVLALRLVERVRVELPEVLTGLGLKLALVLGGNPLTLRVTELEVFTAPSDTVELTLEPRFTVIDDGDAEIVKSAGGAETTTVRVVE